LPTALPEIPLILQVRFTELAFMIRK
jgi:hypothetical protein